MMIDRERIIRQVRLILEKSKCPSASITVYDNGAYIHIPVGLRNIEKRLEADENTLYAIGSSTKAFVAEALCILSDEGKLSLDDTVKKHIPEFAMHDPYVTETLTVRDILCHRCGLPRHEFSWYPRMAQYKPKDLVDRLRYFKPFAPLRYKFNYQNHMFMLAGYLVERVCGQPWEQFVTERIFEPLGMTNSCFRTAIMAKDPNAATGYYYVKEAGINEVMPYKDITVMGAAGSINSSTAQMAKWVALQLGEGKYEGRQIVSEPLIRQCHAPQTVIEADPTDNPEVLLPSYGLGWYVEVYRGRKVVHHGGNIDGFSATQCFLPNTGFGFSILTNGNANWARNAIQYALIDEYFGSEPIDWATFYDERMAKMQGEMEEDGQMATAEKPTNAPPVLSLENACGTFEHPGYGDLIVTVENGKLCGEYGTVKLIFEHDGYNHFTTKIPPFDDAAFQARLEVDRSGRAVVICIDFEPAIGEMIEFRRVK